MADSKSYQYFDLAKPILPYKSYTSPVDESPHFIRGSQNIMASQIGYLEKRPGFSTNAEGTPSVLAGTIKRLFTWRRWNGPFYLMACAVSGSNAVVYAMDTGASFVSLTPIWTSTSNVPFDFIVSNNFVYFGNGTDMKKWDGTTVSKWGCDAPPTAPSVSLQSATLPPGMTVVDDLISGTPTALGTSQITWTATDSTGAVASKTFNFTVVPPVLAIIDGSYLPERTVGTIFSQAMIANYGTPGYTWTLFSGALPAGVTLSGGGTLAGTPTVAGTYAFALQVTDSLGATAVKGFSVVVQSNAAAPALAPTTLPAALVGNAYSEVITASGGTGPYTFQIIPFTGVHQDPIVDQFPQGFTVTTAPTTITISATNPLVPESYFFRIVVTDSLGAITVQDYTLVVNPTAFSIVTSALSTAVQGYAFGQVINVAGGIGPYTWTFSAGSLDAQTGYVYGYSYTTVYGHESNVSPLSVSTGIFTGLDPAVILIASSDPQVNGINLYRTTDGGVPDPAIMRLVVSLANINQTYADSTLDIDLGSQTGPGFLINTPPTPQRGFVWSNGRIYGFINATTYYSGLEEVSNGIPEEAWPSGVDGNYYNWPSQVGGMAVTAEGVDIGLSEQFWQISGDSLDTFRKSLLLDKAGVQSPTEIHSVGNSVQWVDSSKQVWSSSLGEFGEVIRTDLATLQPSTTYIGYHKYGNFNWEYVLDATAGRLYIYDLDTDQWYPPWTVPATAIWSGEVAVGVIRLFVAIAGTVYFLNTSPVDYRDAANVYEDDIKLSLTPISPGRTTTGRSKIQPTQVEDFMFEMPSTPSSHPPFPAFVGQLCDDDPISAGFYDWFNLTANSTKPQFVPQGKYLYQMSFKADSQTDPAIRVAFWIQFPAQDIPWKIFSISIGWIPA